jgi:phage head maturation protease
MIPQFITIKGYAVPFNRTVWIGDRQECFARCAFDAMFAAPRRRNVKLMWASHDDGAPVLANVDGRSLNLFCDDYGLGFLAVLDMRSQNGCVSGNWGRLADLKKSRNPVNRCSIGEFHASDSFEDEYLGAPRLCIMEASVGHISIVSNAAYRDFTGAWDSGCVADAPWRVRDMAEQWESGWRAWHASHAVRNRCKVVKTQASKSARVIGRSVSGSIVMLSPSGRLFAK